MLGSCLFAAFDLLATSVTVSTPQGIYDAIDRALKEPSAPREIVLEGGDYYLPRAIRLRGPAASNFTFRAERPGTVRLYGGVRLGGWTAEAGTPFFCADVPGWKKGESVPFRSLVKNDEWLPLATYPGEGKRFEHLGQFAPGLLPALAGHWSRNPTHEEFVTMPYRGEDLADSLALENADIRLYHMWSDSLCTVSNVDRTAHVLRVNQHPSWAMGACNRRKYEVLNLREGMLAPGQWYLDRDRGRVHYWPKPGEDLAKLTFVVPTLKHVFDIEGGSRWNPRTWVGGLAIRDLTVSVCAPGIGEMSSFGGSAISAAVSVVGVTGFTLSNVVIRNVGGSGLLIAGSRGARVTDCDIAFTGARGAGFEGCDEGVIERNRIADVGLIHRASCGMSANGIGTCWRANEICRIPYCGIIGGGSDNLYASNYIHHVMQVLHDGGAIYGGFSRCRIQGNVVHDIVANGAGFGVHAYYPDEGSRDCVVEDNYAEGVMTPIHNHMTLRTVIRNNTLVNRGDLRVSFQRSMECAFSNNTLVCGGQLSVADPDGVPHWERNFAVRPSDPANAQSRRVIGEWNPARAAQPKKWTPDVARAARAPEIDGRFLPGEWPDRCLTLDRTLDGHNSGFSTANVRFLWDDECLYAAVLTANFRDSPMREGEQWGVDDGVELAFANGLRLRAYFAGKTEIPAAAQGVRVWAGRDPGIDIKKTWLNRNVGHFEFAIPWKALGVVPKAGLVVPFNVFAFVSEFGQFKCWEGTGAQPGAPTGSLRLQ